MAKRMKKILSCFIVLVILMSTMLVAAVVANDSNNSMIEDNLASALQTSTEKSSLTVNVYDINKRPLPPNNGEIKVVLWSYSDEIGSETVAFNARDTKASVTFYNIPPSTTNSTYDISVYQTPDVKDGQKEYWGGKGGLYDPGGVVVEEGSNTLDFVRYGQWISNVQINGKCPWTDEIVVDALEEVSIDITVKSDGLKYEEKTYVRLYLDQDTDPDYDFNRLSSIVPIGKGDSYTFHFDYTPQRAGIYYFAIFVFWKTIVPGVREFRTDQHEWYKGFTVTGEEVGTIYATSSPSGANVYLDGTYEGTTPKSISDVSVGTHTVKFTKSGYNDCQETVTVSTDQQTDVFCTLDIFDTGSPVNSYSSISGTHMGTIKPNQDITVSKLYTYPCAGTGGHTESVRIYGYSIDESASWTGYVGDWHNITFDNPFILVGGKTYNYVIKTGSYPQIHHTPALQTETGWINCTKFVDANGKEYDDWIPAIRLFS